MALEEHPREDLIREAVALTRRIELRLEGEAAPIVVGFRRDGSGSVYFGDDPVVQFNSRHELRRGYRAGRLLKAEQGRLVSLTRMRTPKATQLMRHELTPAETAECLNDLGRRLARLRDALDAGRCVSLRQVPEGEDVLAHARDWIHMLRDPLPVAQSPAAG